MNRRLALLSLIVIAALAQDRPTFRVKVDMVVLSFQIVDKKGHYISHLKSKEFRILEDGIPEKIVSFAEGSQQPIGEGTNGLGAFTGTNVFVLFDTSNYMYGGFVYASEAIADFVRGLDRTDSVAVYTYSRNLIRVAPLTRDRDDAIFGLRKAIVGDASAMYNCLLLTLRDAAKLSGRKVVIMFSNGPDNASVVAPNSAQAVAEDEGIPIYVISTSDVNRDPISSSAFKRISTSTGGKSYFAKTWQEQVAAFQSIREDLGNSYNVTYYPEANANEGFRKITVEVLSDTGKQYRVQCRPGYRPQTDFERTKTH